MKKLISFLAVGSMVLSLTLVNVALADSTIGTNMSTTGSLTVNSGSATAIQFQNGSGTNVFIFNTSNKRFGIGAAPGTIFEAQGTASASYFLTGNTLQVGGYASVAYSRFGTGATGHGLSANNDLLITGFTEFDKKAYFDATASAAYFFSQNAAQFAGNASVAYSRFGTTTTNHANYISAANDLLISGDVEIRGSASFGGTASVSGVFYMNDGRFRPNENSATAFRFQNTAGTTNVLTIDTTSTRVGVNSGTALDTKFEVGGTASATNLMVSGAVQFAGNASVAYSRFGTGATGHSLAASNDLLVTGLLEVDSNAFFDSKASISSNLQISGRFIADTAASHSFRGDLTVTRAARIGTTGYQDTTFEVGGTASVGTNFNVGEVSTATTSIIFETRATDKGVCLVMTDTTGTVRYLRLFGNTLTINTTNCNQ